MKLRPRHVILIVSLICAVLALYFGLDSRSSYLGGEGLYGPRTVYFTDWGKVALTLVFGGGACIGFAALLRK